MTKLTTIKLNVKSRTALLRTLRKIKNSSIPTKRTEDNYKTLITKIRITGIAGNNFITLTCTDGFRITIINLSIQEPLTNDIKIITSNSFITSLINCITKIKGNEVTLNFDKKLSVKVRGITEQIITDDTPQNSDVFKFEDFVIDFDTKACFVTLKARAGELSAGIKNAKKEADKKQPLLTLTGNKYKNQLTINTYNGQNTTEIIPLISASSNLDVRGYDANFLLNTLGNNGKNDAITMIFSESKYDPVKVIERDGIHYILPIRLDR